MNINEIICEQSQRYDWMTRNEMRLAPYLQIHFTHKPYGKIIAHFSVWFIQFNIFSKWVKMKTHTVGKGERVRERDGWKWKKKKLET